VPEDPDTDYLDYYGYGPPIFAEGYDYPLQHGYGGLNHAAGSVIEADYLDSDMNTEYATFLTPAGIKRTGTTSPFGYRVCADPAGGASCDGTIGAPDPEGESTLDATAILTEAPYADFYEFLAPAFNDAQIESAYEIAVSQDKVDAVNSSFGGCETDDPSFEYATSYIAMEGAALGITFSASAGDTGAYSCGTYISNGTVQGFLNTSTPADDNYFTGVGGTSYLQITPVATDDYQGEIAWVYGGGGHSVIEPIPSWQTTLVGQSSPAALVSTTFRNVPDITMVADPGTNPDGFIGGVAGGGLVICHNGALIDSGGTSLASPMWVAMQTDINDAEHSRNGFVNPSLYAIAAASSTEYAFAFRDITAGSNVFYTAETGYDDASTGIGSPLGFELVGAPEYGTPGATAAPIASPTPTPTASPVPTGASPTPSPSPTPANSSTPHQSGTNFTVTTIGGAACTMTGSSLDATIGNMACFANPTAIQYVPAGTSDAQSTTDPYVFITDYATGFLRGQDLTTSGVVTYNNTTWSNLGAVGNSPSQLFGLTYQTSSGSAVAFDGLFVVNAENNTTNQITLPTTVNATPSSILKNLTGGASAEAWDGTGTDLATVSETDDTLHILTVAAAEGLDLTASTALPTQGNFGIAFDGAATLPSYVITDSGLNEVFTATDVPGTTEVPVNTSTLTTIAMGAPLSNPKQITYISGTSAFYVANCGGNNILRISATSPYTVTVAAGYGAPTEKDGANTGAGFDCPWGITNDGTNLYVTDQAGGTVRKITNVI